VLKGAQKLFSTSRPSILFESNDRPGTHEITPVMKWLHEQGYRFIVIPPRVLRMKTRVMEYNRPATSWDTTSLPCQKDRGLRRPASG